MAYSQVGGLGHGHFGTIIQPTTSVDGERLMIQEIKGEGGDNLEEARGN